MSEGNERQKTILIVDDHEAQRELTCYVFESCGYRVVEAADGLEAISLAQSVRPDLILMDLSMPTLDGFEAIHRIRRLFGMGDLPVIAVSAHAAPEVRSDALAAGFREFFVKPVDFKRLCEVVARLVRADAKGEGDSQHAA